MEEKKKHGGARKNSGAPLKVDSLKTNTIIINAVKQITGVDTDEEARIEIVKELYKFERGKMFIAEHLLGKPKETIETTHNVNNFDIKDLFKVDKHT
jgi:hypothetical protein